MADVADDILTCPRNGSRLADRLTAVHNAPFACCGEIRQRDKRTDGQTDRQTVRPQGCFMPRAPATERCAECIHRFPIVTATNENSESYTHTDLRRRGQQRHILTSFLNSESRPADISNAQRSFPGSADGRSTAESCGTTVSRICPTA